MKGWRIWRTSPWGLLAFLAAGLLALPASAVQLVDDRGVTVTLEQPARRIVSLLPSLTEVVCELGACDRLVGVDTYSNWPPQVRPLAHVGGLEDSSVEQIVALKPDVVLLATSARALDRLQGLGLKVVALEPRTLADLQRVMRQVDLVLGTRQAEPVWRRIDAQVDAAARSLPASLRGARVYFEVNSAPYAASEASFIGELLARLGVANIVPGQLGPFPKLNPEFVVRADPQFIMVSDRNGQSISARPGWERIRAVREGHVCLFSPAQGDVLVRAGPRMAEGAQLMVQCLTGQLRRAAPPGGRAG